MSTIELTPETDVRRAANTSRRKVSVVPSAPPGYVSYGDRRPYVVADSLDELTGPTTGTVTLPQHLDWSGNASYDLDRPARLASMYRTVLMEAGAADDLRVWIDGGALARLWPTLWLPPPLRRLWEGRFPELSAAHVDAA